MTNDERSDTSPESLYEKGMECMKGSVSDHARAVDYLNAASKTGYIPAMRELGLMYLNGMGVDRDYNRAFDLLSEAAGSMDPHSMYGLASMHEKGLGIDKDLYKALRFFAFAANMGIFGAEMDADRVEELIRTDRRNKLKARPVLNLEISDVDIEAACCKLMLDNALNDTIYVIETYQGPELVSEDEDGFEVVLEKCPFCGKKVKRVLRNKKY